MDEPDNIYTVVLTPSGERGSAVLHIDLVDSPHEACEAAKNELETEYPESEWRVLAVFKGKHIAALLGEDV